MGRIGRGAVLLALILILVSGCALGRGGGRKTVDKAEMPEAPGTQVYTGTDAAIDASNAAKGYVMVRYTGSADKVQVQVTGPKGTRTPYPFEKGSYHAVPLSEGDGSYTIVVYAHVSGTSYAVALSQRIDVKLTDEFGPFLYPNQYVAYTNNSACTAYAKKLSDRSDDDLDYITRVFNYVTGHITYDNDLAAHIPVNYLPDPDKTMSSGKGICLDYAALMTAMLRAQGIPTKLEVGYNETVYHAWISVYLKEKGWVDGIIQFDGKNWTLVDPTLAAESSKKKAGAYMKDRSHYTAMYQY
ncbi:MAG: transglutaminase domain-containing protein [Eubacteriaceae bacterium]|uniref:Transglutaminase domain-containing protein n=1 Tax=Candidatus Pseudoramibacter fermentans TaxID=2594427 RepID=A0A6L5GP03_9FIRM|nr:transglutaminase domain-containing protein [Candidatus Pseudoramibacter fermentans]RRF92443.1 MAG: transglutaminase domain-containing protein [Eubacteriaceae bacterium]